MDWNREAHMFDEGGEDFIDGEDPVRILYSCQMTDEDGELGKLACNPNISRI